MRPYMGKPYTLTRTAQPNEILVHKKHATLNPKNTFDALVIGIAICCTYPSITNTFLCRFVYV